MEEIKPIGFSVRYRGHGHEPVVVYSDLTFHFIYPQNGSHANSNFADAMNIGRELASFFKLPFRRRVSTFKYILNEVTLDA